MRKTWSLGALAVLAALAALLLHAGPARSYTPQLTGGSGNLVAYHWGGPVQWNLNPNHGGNVSGNRPLADAIQASFNTWSGAPNQALQVSRGPDSSIASEDQSPNGINLICFTCSDSDFGSSCGTVKDGTDNTLAVTITTAQDASSSNPGQLIKADILFNPCVNFSTDSPVPATGSTQDLQVVATHEIGHFFGLDHSAVVRSMMFPSAGGLLTLSYDDLAAISLLYPKAAPDVATGSISGFVNQVSGGGVFEAHVFAESTTAAAPFPNSIRKSPVGAFTRPDGSYVITGLPPDSYEVWAEPLDGPMEGGDISWYAPLFGQQNPQTNFTSRPH